MTEISSIIVNADDFGLSSSVNAAILQCFEQRWITSTSIMPNMPSFEEACDLADKYKLHNNVGVHIVLTEGQPLTDKIKLQQRFCDENGQFHLTRRKRIFHLDADEKIAVAEEMHSQIMRCRINGLKLSHLDSHHHIHEELGIARVVIPLLSEFKIPLIRIMNTMDRSSSLPRKCYTVLYNACINHYGLKRSDCFGSMEQYIQAFNKKQIVGAGGKRFEIMVHPVINNGSLVDASNKKNIGKLLQDAGLQCTE